MTNHGRTMDMKFEFPDTLPDNADDLADLRAKALEAFNDTYKDNETPSADELAELEALVDGIKSIDAKQDELSGADDRAKSAADLADRLNNGDGDGDGDDEGDEGDDEGEGQDDDAEPSEPAEGKQPVTAAGGKKRTSFSHAASGHNPKDVPAQDNGWRLTTSAQNFETGIVDSNRVAKEFGSLAAGGAARVLGLNGKSRTTLAYLDRQTPDELTIRDDAEANKVLDYATREDRLQGGSLTAAGGWGAPSETIYDFLPVQAPTGLLSLPEVTVTRGGVRFPVEPDFGAIYDQIGFHQTEAQAEAGEEKPAYEIPGAEFEELRLEVEGVQIVNPILQDKAWPELTAKFVDEALRLHQHKINAWRINKILGRSTDVGTLTGEIFGTAGAVLSAVELQVADMRARHRIPRTQSVEGIAPEWLLSILRADLAYREGVLPEQVTDAQLNAHFTNIGASLQFVADWQTDVLGTATPATAWPETVDIVLYPSGTFWAATEPVINLGIIHDSALLKQNKQIQMFTEDGVAVGKRGPESRVVSIPVGVNGTVGARHQIAASGGTTTE